MDLILIVLILLLLFGGGFGYRRYGYGGGIGIGGILLDNSHPLPALRPRRDLTPLHQSRNRPIQIRMVNRDSRRGAF